MGGNAAELIVPRPAYAKRGTSDPTQYSTRVSQARWRAPRPPVPSHVGVPRRDAGVNLLVEKKVPAGQSGRRAAASGHPRRAATSAPTSGATGARARGPRAAQTYRRPTAEPARPAPTIPISLVFSRGSEVSR